MHPTTMQATGNKHRQSVNNSSPSIQSTGPATGGLLSSTPRFCLVPEALYREEDQDLWLNFLQEHIPHDQHIQADRIAEAGCVCLHQTESETTEEHCIARLLRTAPSVAGTDKMLCLQNGGRLCATLFLHGCLQLANVYDTPTAPDCLFYLLDICRQYGINPLTLPVSLASPDEELRTMLTPYINLRPLSL